MVKLSQCDNRVIHSVTTGWYTVWQHGDTQCGNMVIHIVATWWERSVRSVTTVWIWPIFTVLIPLKQYFHSVDTQCNTLCSIGVDTLWPTAWTHSVAHCVLRCGDTVIHRVFTQFHSVKMGQIHTVVIVWTQCGPQGVPHCVSTLWLTLCFFRQGIALVWRPCFLYLHSSFIEFFGTQWKDTLFTVHSQKASYAVVTPLRKSASDRMSNVMPWSHLCVKPPRMSNVRQI